MFPAPSPSPCFGGTWGEQQCSAQCHCCRGCTPSSKLAPGSPFLSPPDTLVCAPMSRALQGTARRDAHPQGRPPTRTPPLYLAVAEGNLFSAKGSSGLVFTLSCHLLSCCPSLWLGQVCPMCLHVPCPCLTCPISARLQMLLGHCPPLLPCLHLTVLGRWQLVHHSCCLPSITWKMELVALNALWLMATSF